jgi:predicted trehalose synthase
MSDIVERLRERATSYRAGGPSSEHTATILEEAAAEIERLNRELDDVWDALAIQREDNASFGDAFKRMTSEIERLKKEALFTADTVLPDKDAEIERLRAALREIASWEPGASAVARAALAQEKKDDR